MSCPFWFRVFSFKRVSSRRRPAKERILIERSLSFFLWWRLNKGFEENSTVYTRTLIFLYHNFQSKIRLLMKYTFLVQIGTFKFSSLFKESPCSPVVTFPNFGWEGHGVQPLRGTPFFHICARFQLYLCFFLYNPIFHYVSN